MAIDDGHYNVCSLENVLSRGERISGENLREVLTRMELDLAYSSEKVLNLEILMMQVADKASDFEIHTMGSEELSTEFIEKASEYDILSGILSSEVKEIESFMSFLQVDIVAAHNFIQSGLLEDSLIEIEEKLYHAEESLRNSLDQVADIKKQSENFERSLVCGTSTDEDLENGQLSPMNAEWKLQTMEQKRHCLQSLEKSLAREMDLEKKLSESRYNEEELKMKLHFAEQEVDCLEDLMERIMEGLFEAENSAELLLRISKEIIGKVQNAQLSSISWSLQSEVESEMDKSMIKPSDGERALKNLETSYTGPVSFPVLEKADLRNNKEVEDKCIASSSEISTLRYRINALEEQLRESENQLLVAKSSVKISNEQQSILYSEQGDMENLITSLKENVLEIQSRAEGAEARCAELMKANVELNDELGFLKSNGTEKANLLERKLKESDAQLEHAKASVDAIEEQQNMLYSALNDMEHTIDDLKGKVLKAESRAESAESKCSLLTETNLELNEELSFLRDRLECLEVSSRQSERAKIATAKDIGNRTKLITELVKKLGLEREHLQLQISALTKRNKTLMEKYRMTKDGSSYNMNHQKTSNSNNLGSIESSVQTHSEFMSTNFQADIPVSTMTSDMKMDPTLAAEDTSPSVSNFEVVRTIDATQLNWKYVLMAFLVLLVSIAAVHLFQFQIS